MGILQKYLTERNIEISPYGSLLVFKKGYTSEFVENVIRKKKLNGLRIFGYFEERLNDLDFLSEYSFLEALDITSLDDYDYSFLSELKDLKKFSLSREGTNSIDLSHQLGLEELSIQWRKGKIIGLEKCQNLTDLCLWNFKEDDFSAIIQLTKLKELVVKTSTIKTLTGVSNFPLLEKLILGNCRSLRSINDIGGLKNLISLHIERCSKIGDYSPIGNLYSLTNFEVTNCKGINTIKFLQNLPLLNKLSLLESTDVLDGDMTPAQNVKSVFYRHRKHYNVRIENKELEESLKTNFDKLEEKRLLGKKAK